MKLLEMKRLVVATSIVVLLVVCISCKKECKCTIVKTELPVDKTIDTKEKCKETERYLNTGDSTVHFAQTTCVWK